MQLAMQTLLALQGRTKSPTSLESDTCDALRRARCVLDVVRT
jgi:hypothetical protein